MSGVFAPATVTKLSPPEARPELIARERVTALLEAAADRSLVVLCAPAGFGKTTALVQWLATSQLDYAWLSLDARDNDPQQFTAHLIAALERRLAGRLDDATRSLRGGSDLLATVVPHLINALDSHVEGRLAIVLDDYHLMQDDAVHALVRALVDGAPSTVSVVLSTRTAPPLRLGRRRAAAAVAELGPEDLRFRAAETGELLNGPLGLALDGDQVKAIDERVEGWAAGLVLVAAALEGKDGRARVLAALDHSRRNLEDYLVEEVLEGARDDLRSFLCRTSVLARLSPELCEAVTGDARARDLLEEIRAMNLFVTALDPTGRWMRYHDLFAESLHAQLQRREPDLVPELHARAAGWFEEQGSPGDALEHAVRGGHAELAARLLSETWLTFIAEQRVATLRRLLERLPRDMGPHTAFCEAVGVLCSLLSDVDQRITSSRARVLVRDHGDDPRVRLICDLVLSTPYYGDVGSALEVARDAWERYADLPAVEPQLAGLYAMTLWFAGDNDAVRELLEPRLQLEQPPMPEIWTHAILALVAVDDADAEAAERHARRAVAGIEAIGAQTATEVSYVYGVVSESLRINGKLGEARHWLARHLEVEPRRPGSVGHGLALIFDAALAIAEGDRARSRASAAQARGILDRFPDVGVLDARLAALEAQLGAGADAPAGSEPTLAELRVLEMLATDRSLAEIADALFLTRNTVKSHVRRIYRRLGVSSRENAVMLARARGMIAQSASGEPLPGSAAR